jgi:hypothetical protein
MLRKTAYALLVAATLAVGSSAYGKDQAAQTSVALDRTLHSVNLTNMTLKDALEFVRDASGANVHVNWRAIEAAGVSPDAPVSLKLRDISAKRVLGSILLEAAGGTALTYYVEDGIVHVTTKELADNVMYTIVYPVQDILVERLTYSPPPEFNLYAEQSGGSGSRRGGGGNSGGSSGSIFDPQNRTQPQPVSTAPKNVMAQELVELIVETVQPGQWRPDGKSAIRFFQGNLVVTAPRSIHEAIGGPMD